MTKKVLLNIKTYEFLTTRYAENTLGYNTQKQIADAFVDDKALQPITALAEEHKQITSAYLASSEQNTKTRHHLSLKQNALALGAYNIISTLTNDHDTVAVSNNIISKAKKYYINEIKKIFMIDNDETAHNKYIATIVDLSSYATTTINTSLRGFGCKDMIEYLIKQKKTVDIRTKYNIDRHSNDIDKLHNFTKKVVSEPQVISDIKSILKELYKTHSGTLDSVLGIK